MQPPGLLNTSVACDIKITSQVKNPIKGGANGEITIIVNDSPANDRYKVFLINKGPEQAKKEIKAKKITGLKAGFYEFIIVDTKGDKCFKELALQLTEG
jgi:hypothetical protein